MRSNATRFACMALVLLTACTRTTDGIEVDIAYQTPPTPQAVRTDMEYKVWLDRALLVLGPVELVECDNFARTVWGLFTAGRARAHAPETPTSLGVPFVLDLLEEGGFGYVVGTIRPPPGRYCGIRVIGAPADGDAANLKGNLEMLESSVFLSGEIEPPDGAERTPFFVQVQDPLVRELRFEEPLVFDSPRSVSVSVRIDHIRWFDGIDFAQLGIAAVQERLTENIVSSMTADRVEGP
ncbi:MAG: hypothetical protein WBG86_15790 [Polyangiales bacterium]